MKLVEGLYWVEGPKNLVSSRSTTTTPNSLTLFGVSLLSDIAAGVSFCFCLETPFLSVCGLNPLSHQPFAVVERLRDIIATTDFFHPPHW
jgi:hypothetical protein